MPRRMSEGGGELFIVDNSHKEWKVRRYLQQWSEYADRLDIATGYFEIGSLLALDGEWQKVDQIRLLMGDEVSLRTRKAFERGLRRSYSTTRRQRLYRPEYGDSSLPVHAELTQRIPDGENCLA